MSNDMFVKMFEHAERVALEDFNDEDLKEEGIFVPEITEDDIAQEGIIKALVGDAVRGIPEAYREMKGWFLGIQSKRNYINEQCQDTIEWLRDEDKSNPKLDLDMGTFKTWMKTSETFYWRYYFLLHDGIYNDIMKSIKNNEISNLEINMDFNMKDRMKVAQMLDSIRSIKDLIVVVEKYRARSNAVFEAMLKRERRIQSFPFQVILLGYNDLNRTVKKIVNLAT